MSFGEKLKYLRTIHNTTQQELADHLKVTRPTIAGYETKGKEPDYNTLYSIAKYFHTSVDYLICNSTDQPENENESDTKYMLLVEQIRSLDQNDYKRLYDYLTLLTNQPCYKNMGTNTDTENKENTSNSDDKNDSSNTTEKKEP